MMKFGNVGRAIVFSNNDLFTARKVSRYGVFSGPYFSVFGLNTRKYGLEKTPNLNTFHAVLISIKIYETHNL